MALKLYNDTDVAAIAEAIRGKNGSEEKYTLSQMPEAVEALQAAEVISPGGIPGYVKEAVQDVITRVQAVRTDGSIVFLAMSDFHHPNDETAGNQTEINTGNLHAAMAAKILSYALDLDFACMLGDVVWGSSNTTQTQLKGQMAQINGYLAECWGSVPQFRTPGNHDGGAYGGYNVGSDYLFSQIGKFNEGAVYGSTTEGYCYRDFADKSLRIICLNTAEGGGKESISDAQLLWFAQTLADTPDGYGIIILSHHPLDWGAVCQASNVVYQFTKRGGGTYNGTPITFAYAGAYVICAVHGHTHCFKTAKLNYIANSVGTEYDVYRIATPNACFNRNNEYGSNGSTEYYGIEFGETTTYAKTAGTAQDTAFVVNVVDPKAQTIHSICYGAGKDRLVYIGKELTIITQPEDVQVYQGEELTMSITAVADGSITYNWEYSTDGSSWNSVTALGAEADKSSFTVDAVVAMSGYQFRCTVADTHGGQLVSNIATATVEVLIVNYTNLVPTLLDLATANQETPSGVFNGKGYMDGAYVSTTSPYYNASDSERVTTGLLPYTAYTQKPIYIKGAAWGTASHDRIGIRASSHISSGIYTTQTLGNTYFSKLFTYELLGDNYFKLTPTASSSWNSYIAGIDYIAFSFVGKGKSLIITIDEPIE